MSDNILPSPIIYDFAFIKSNFNVFTNFKKKKKWKNQLENVKIRLYKCEVIYYRTNILPCNCIIFLS